MVDAALTQAEHAEMNTLQTRVNTGEAVSDEEALRLALLKQRYHMSLLNAEYEQHDADHCTETKACAASDISSATKTGQQSEERDVGSDTQRLTQLSSSTPTVTAPVARCDESSGGSGTGGRLTSSENTVADSLSKAQKAVYFWSSLVATAVPGYLGKKTGLTSQFMHWNYIVPHLLLGAIPVVTRVGSSGNHLDQLRRQLEERNEQLGLVVACLEDDELNGFGVNVIQFAKEVDWRRHVNRDVVYIRVPMEDTTASVQFESVVRAVEHIHQCIAERKQTAYVHCKAGKGRSWMVVMAYLTTYGGLLYNTAARLVQERRGQINPSLSQQCFAREFATRYAQLRTMPDGQRVEGGCEVSLHVLRGC